MMTQFSAPWSRFLKVISAVISIVICVAFWFAAPTTTVNETVPFQTFLILFPVAMLGSAAIFIIRRYEVTDGHIEIVRIIGRTKYAIDNIETIAFEPKATALSIRTMGNGGLYSISGFFRNKELGAYRAYVTNSANTVVIRRKKGSPIVISPGEPTDFVDAVNDQINRM